MDYLAARASRKRVWDALVRIDDENRRKPSNRTRESEIRQPLSIVQVERDGESNCSELLELCYRLDTGPQKWLCSFCGNTMKDHSWSSFDSKEDGVVVPRWQPAYCTLGKLLDRIAQDFFPRHKVSLDTDRSHWNNQIVLVFHEFDELSTVMSTTRIELQKPKQKHKSASFQAMNINQQLEALKGWLEICEKDSAEGREEIHKQCQKDNDLVIPAKRVLNLADAATGIVHIVETANHKGRYLALSHCWGDPKRHPLMSTHATLKDHMSGITISSLPRSFRDAINVCLHLGIQYLWIDCLCIVQDDSAEWLAEAEKMVEIYQESYLTVAATRAQNSQHGFLFDFPDDTVHYGIVAEAPWDRDVSKYRTFHATFQINHEDSKRESTPLDRRAWCLQEWYLPKRVVEFCLNDIRFLCLRSSETRFGRKADEHTRTRTIVRGFCMEREDLFRRLWESIRGDFFGRSLTKPSDMLPAMAGLAQMLEKALLGVADHRYLAGLWSTRISEDLSWTVLDFDTATESIEGIPTWSWASTTAPSGYIYYSPSETFIDLVEAHCTGYARPKETPASLKVKGFVVSLYLRVDHRHKDYKDRPSLSFWVNENSAMTTTTEEIEARKKTSQTTSVFVLDMPICPAPHDHEAIRETNDSRLRRAPSIVRASERQAICNICTENGYVSPVQLLLLTRTDVGLTALVLAPVSSQLSKGKERRVREVDETFQRLGLLEIDCIRQAPWMETADGLKVPAEAFWEIDNPSARITITIV